MKKLVSHLKSYTLTRRDISTPAGRGYGYPVLHGAYFMEKREGLPFEDALDNLRSLPGEPLGMEWENGVLNCGKGGGGVAKMYIFFLQGI